jgi:effector-binding domain-containing protein
VEIVAGPEVVTRPETACVGIRVVTPFRGMLAKRDELMAELLGWLDDRKVGAQGPLFLRLHVIDMNGPMDLEVGLVTADVVEGDDRVRAGVLPGGRYASLTYVDHARRANGTLLDWAATSGVRLDRWDGPTGDHFACRYEAYLTDPRSEPRKTKWHVQLNIRVADDSP